MRPLAWTWLLVGLALTGCKLTALHSQDRVPDCQLALGSRSVSLYSLLGKAATAVVFMSTECPCCDDYRPRFDALIKRWKPSGVTFVAVDENQVVQIHPNRQPDHGPWASLGWTLVADAGGETAKHFGAEVTPEVFVLDPQGVLRYHGGIDDSEDVHGVKTSFLEDALGAVVQGRTVLYPVTKPTGCYIPGVTPGAGG